ncbi:MAG: DUF4911 domain-containing protein [Desulfuromonadales bacterium]|nr:DUF4911 domain-containing protein [Desulfuromonadales bacterium]
MPDTGRCTEFDKGYFRLPKREIGYLRFILESYDGLVFMRTIDSKQGLVEIAWPPVRAADAKVLIAAMGQEAGLAEVDAPEEVPPL